MNQGLSKMIKHWVKALQLPKQTAICQLDDAHNYALEQDLSGDEAERLYKEICRECHRIERMTGIHINPS